MARRPLSPHLQIYRPQITSVLSITHRLTGLILGAGAVFFALMLVLAAWFPQGFEAVRHGLSGWWGWPILLGWVWAFFYHGLNGIRHMVWDLGYGFEPRAITLSGMTVVLISMVAACGLCGWWWAGGGM